MKKGSALKNIGISITHTLTYKPCGSYYVRRVFSFINTGNIPKDFPVLNPVKRNVPIKLENEKWFVNGKFSPSPYDYKRIFDVKELSPHETVYLEQRYDVSRKGKELIGPCKRTKEPICILFKFNIEDIPEEVIDTGTSKVIIKIPKHTGFLWLKDLNINFLGAGPDLFYEEGKYNIYVWKTFVDLGQYKEIIPIYLKGDYKLNPSKVGWGFIVAILAGILAGIIFTFAQETIKNLF